MWVEGAEAMPSPCTAGQTSQVCPVLCERPALGGHAIFRVEGSVKLIDPRRIGYDLLRDVDFPDFPSE